MYHQLYNGGLITIDDISYISEIEYPINYLRTFIYKIYFKSGTILEKQLSLDLDDDNIWSRDRPYQNCREKIDKTINDIRNCSFYRNFEKSYNELVEKYKAYNAENSEIDNSCWTYFI